MAIHPSILAWEIPCTEEPGHSPWGCSELFMTEHTHTSFLGYKLVGDWIYI